MNRLQAEKLQRKAYCPEPQCERKSVVIAFAPPPERGYIVVCSTDASHELQTPHNQSLRRRYEADGKDGLSAIDLMTLARQLRNRVRWLEADGVTDSQEHYLLERLEKEMSTGLTVYTPTSIITQDDATRFVDLAKVFAGDLKAAAIEIIIRTGLNPLMGELTVYEGKIYPTIDGLRHLALGSGLFRGMEGPFFLSADEKLAEGYEAEDIVARVKMYRTGIEFPFIGTGKANRNNPHRNSAVEKAWTPRLAENRAYRQGFKLAFQDLFSTTRLNLNIPDELDDEDAYTGEAHEVPVSSTQEQETPSPASDGRTTPAESPQKPSEARQTPANGEERQRIVDAAKDLWGPEWSSELHDWLADLGYPEISDTKLTTVQATAALAGLQALWHKKADKQIAEQEQAKMKV